MSTSKMNKYLVTAERAGYCREYDIYEVEAESEEKAKKGYWNGRFIDEEIIIDDRELDSLKVELVEDEETLKE